MDTVKARCKRLGSQFRSEANRDEDSIFVGVHNKPTKPLPT
jgi:hypothetical protein